MKGVTILGSTGSVGVNTLDVIARHRGELRAVALTAYGNDARLFDQCLEHRPDLAVLVDGAAAGRLRNRLHDAGLATRVLDGSGALEEAARYPQADCIMAAIVGAAGLLPTLAAARTGKRLMLANKESLVMSGQLLIETARSRQPGNVRPDRRTMDAEIAKPPHPRVTPNLRDYDAVCAAFSWDAAARALTNALEAAHPDSVVWYLDSPVSNSGKLATRLRALFEARGLNWRVALVRNADHAIRDSEAVAASSDSWVLDVAPAWVDLVGAALDASVPEAWSIDTA